MKFQKRLLIMVMVAVITISTIFTTSIDMRNVNASSIALPIAGIAVTLMAAYGISLFNGDSSAYDDQYWQNYYDDMEESYNKERSAKIAQFPTGGGDWDDEDGDGDKDKDDLPTWQEFSKVNNKQLNLSANGYLLGSIFAASFATTMFENSCVGGYAKDSGKVFNPAVKMSKNMTRIPSNSRNKIYKGFNDFGCTSPEFLKELNTAYQSNRLLGTSKYINSKGSIYYEIFYKSSSIKNSDNFFIEYYDSSVSNASSDFLHLSETSNTSFTQFYWGNFKDGVWLNRPDTSSFCNFTTPSIICLNPNIALKMQEIGSPNIIEVDDSRYGMYVHPLLKDSYDKLKKVKLPKPCTTPLEVPDLSRIKEMTDAVDNPLNDPAKLKDLTTNFLEQIRPDLNPNFTPKPDPTPDPKPDPTPDPKPDPTPDPKPEGNPEVDSKPFLADLKTLFPFCIPFDLIHAFKIFNKPPETPNLEWTLNVPFINYHYTFVIDLSMFDSVAIICRSMFLILFIVSLIIATRALIKG